IRPTVESSVLALMEFFEKQADKEAFNIFPFYKEFSLDVIYRIAMGQRESELFSDKEKVAAVDYIFRTNPRQPVFYLASVIPSLRIPIRKLYIAAAPSEKKPSPRSLQQDL
ncbi:hypothetical protein OSTOST_12010, partial [Ostertagia ostertagi]